MRDIVVQGVYKRIVGAMSGLATINVKVHKDAVPSFDSEKGIIYMPTKISFADTDEEAFEYGKGITVHESSHVLFLPPKEELMALVKEMEAKKETMPDFHDWHNTFADVNNEWKTGEIFPHLKKALRNKTLGILRKSPDILKSDNPMVQVLCRCDTLLTDQKPEYPDKYDEEIKEFVEDTVKAFKEEHGESMKASDLIQFTTKVTERWGKLKKSFKDNPFGSGGKGKPGDIIKKMTEAINNKDDAEYERLKKLLEDRDKTKREWFKDTESFEKLVKNEDGGKGEFGEDDIDKLKKKVSAMMKIPGESVAWGDADIVGEVETHDTPLEILNRHERYDNDEAYLVGKKINRVLRQKIKLQDDFESRQRSGVIDMENIRSQIAKTGRLTSETVFKREINYNRLGGELAISLLADCSGSMMGKKMSAAKQAFATLGYALDGIANLHYEMVGFTSDEGGTDEVMDLFVKRYRDKKIDVSKLEKLGSHTGNCDGITLRAAIKRIMRYKPLKKIIIIISDGQPAYHKDGMDGTDDTKAVVKKAKSLGIKMVGIGIQDPMMKEDNVKVSDIYPDNNYTVTEGDDLSEKLIGCMMKALNGAGKGTEFLRKKW